MSMAASSPDESKVDTSVLYEEILNLLYKGEGAEAFSSLLQKVQALEKDGPMRSSLLSAVQRALAVSQRMELHQQNDRGLRAVFESAQALTGLKELNQVLSQIVERGRKLLGSDLAWLADVEPVTGRWTVLSVDGVHTHDILGMNPPVDQGIAGHVRKTRLPFSTQNYAADSRFEHNTETDISVTREGLQAVIAVPLLSEDEVTGILIVGDRYARTYLSWEISILSILATHASIAVRNAQAFDLTRQALTHAEHANLRLKEQTRALEFAAEAHERLAKLLAKGGNLKQLTQMVAQMLDGQVRFLDAAGIELCVATPTGYEAPEVSGLGKTMAGIDSNLHAAISQSRVAGGSVATRTIKGYFCQVAAVLSGDELLGAMVIHTREKMTEQAVRIFERSATATAVLRLSAEKKSASFHQDVNLTVRGLLDPNQHSAGDLVHHVERLGLDTTAGILVALIQADREKTPYVIRKLSEQYRAFSPMVADIDGNVVMLINHSDPLQLQGDLTVLLFAELNLSGVASLSGPHLGLPPLAQAYGHLKRSISLLHGLKRTQCVVQESELRMYAVLFQHQSADELDAFFDAVVGRLLAHDAKRNTQFAHTLLAYLDHMQNARATAKHLHIHVNTLHNRLENIANLLGSWDTDGRAVEIHLALRLLKLKASPH